LGFYRDGCFLMFGAGDMIGADGLNGYDIRRIWNGPYLELETC
jgi:hypothetical protein